MSPSQFRYTLDLVVHVDRSDRVLAVHDDGEGRLEDDVGHAGRIVGADRMGAVDDELHVEPVMAKENGGRRRRLTPVADERRRVGQPGPRPVGELHHQLAALDGVAACVGVRASAERHDVVEEGPAPSAITRPPRSGS